MDSVVFIMSSISTVAYGHSVCAEETGTDGWGFASLILVVGSLFVRPSDLIPQLRNVSVYQYLIILAMILSYKSIGEQLKRSRLSTRPVTFCMFLLVASVLLSHIANGFFWGARDSAWMLTKLIALYLLVAGCLSTPQRIELFLKWFLFAISAMCSLALADHYGLLELTNFSSVEDRTLSEQGSEQRLSRICGSGIFSDPNDLGLAVITGVVLALYFLTKPGLGWPRYLWMPHVGILLWTLAETFSRGAFLALATTIPAVAFYWQRWSLTTIGSMALVPFLAFPFSGRMTEINSVYEGTGQTRIQIWYVCFNHFKDAPIFGIGEGMFAEKNGVVAHNSFLHTYTELGFVGGTVLIAIFISAFVGLLQRRVDEKDIAPELFRLRGAIFVVLVAYTVGIFTLSRQFIAPTYLLIGIASATAWTISGPPTRSWQVGTSLAMRSSLIGFLFLCIVYFAIKIFLRDI